MPAMIVPRGTLDLIETTAVSGSRGLESVTLHTTSLQNPTEWQWDSPFFGSVFERFRFDRRAITRDGKCKVKIVCRSDGKNIVIAGFW
jgi:hypothetical protein